MSRTRLIFVIAAILTIAGIIAIISNPTKKKQVTVDPKFRTYVNAFTSGIISKDATIRVQLQNSYADSSMIGKPVDQALFDFSPEIKGDAYWIDTYTVEFRPGNYLEPDQHYKAEFLLGKLMEVPEEFETMEFSFRTIRQYMDIKTGNLKFLPGKQVKWLKLNGEVLTADVESTDRLTQTLKAYQDKKQLEVIWTSTADPNAYQFRIDSIERKEKASTILIEWDGEPVNSDQKGKEEIEITPLGDFKLRKVTANQKPDQHIILEFSDPLDQDQDLEGLINISNNKLDVVLDQNIAKVYPKNDLQGKVQININRGIKNILGSKLSKTYRETAEFPDIEPNIKLKGKGVIMPSSNGLVLPFEGVNLRAVDLTVFRIYEDNILQFLQQNNLDGNNELYRVAKIVYKGTVTLNSSQNPVTDYSTWNDFAIDLSTFIKPEKGAIYRIRINLRKEYSTYPCPGEDNSNMIPLSREDDSYSDEPEYDDWGYYRLYSDQGSYPSDYSWRERNNPCHSSYYYSKSFTQNIIASDIGIIAKRGKDGRNIIFVNHLVSTEPLAGVKIEVYDFQQQKFKTAITNSHGKAEFSSHKKPFVIVAKKGDERGYLKMNDGLSNSLSKFDVSGAGLQKGLNGFIYGERDVWRPGDTLFMSFMLEDKLSKLPAGVPAVCKFYTPRGQLHQKIVDNSPVDHVYHFPLKTSKESETGMWRIEVRVGHARFTKYARIETIKPNRLKIKLDFDKDEIKRWDIKPGELHVEWLHGGTASHLKTISEVTLRPLKNAFVDHKNYHFHDPAKDFSSETFTVFEGTVDNNGTATIIPDFNLDKSAPGVLNAQFKTRVFEKGGNANINIDNFTYHPYRSYAGLMLPGGDSWYNPLETGKNNRIDITNIDPDGRKLPANELKVEVYKLSHSWWYDYSGNRLQKLLNDNYSRPYSTERIHVKNGKARFNLRVNKPDHGRYYIRVMDMNSGHTTGEIVYVSGNRWWQKDEDKDFASLLIFKSSKEKYYTGETIELKIPSSKNSKILISLENGMGVIHNEWVNASDDETTWSIKATKDMAPAVYAHITLIQPHARTENDLPIRLYGVIPIAVEAKETHLHPQISCAETFRPEAKATIRVSEKSDRPMTYTLAIVDEGLLDLTGYNTPDPWSYFYQKKALGVKTWDIYDYVIGAFGGNINRLLSVGGDGYAEIDKDKGEVNRFKPMVRFSGPVRLKAGETNKHIIDIPQYIGSVKVMVVARENEAYGSAEKTVKVKNPLMVLGTLPRVLSPGEEVELPVNVFAMEDDVKNVSVDISASDIFEIEGDSRQKLHFKSTGDKLARFRLKVKDAVGNGKVVIKARSGGHTANHTIEIKVNNPNPVITDTKSSLISASENIELKYQPVGMRGTNKAVVEVSSIPPMDLSKRLEYLIRYPYGCVEQTTSSVFPQLYLSAFEKLSEKDQKDIARNIHAAIQVLRRMQHGNGGFGYWPGASTANDWGSSYAGHFLTEAEKKGYNLPAGMLDSWYSYQNKAANSYNDAGNNRYRYDLRQAYRLYTLANYGKPSIGAMNRLKESRLEPAAVWMLAAAYAKSGQTSVAKELLNNAPKYIEKYEEFGYTYGSRTRDYAIMVDAMINAGMDARSFEYVKLISEKLSSNEWLSTQTIAFSLLAVSSYVQNNQLDENLKFDATYNGKKHQISQTEPISTIELEPSFSQNITIKNKSGVNLFVRLVRMGQPMENPISDRQQNLWMSIRYEDTDGNRINPVTLMQGTDFVAEVTVRHPGGMGLYQELALEQVFPSGWEITGMRLRTGYSAENESDYFDYQDVRDDAVYTFFDLDHQQEKTFRVNLNASYSGRFYHPVIQCKAMYSDNVFSYRSGYWVKVETQ